MTLPTIDLRSDILSQPTEPMIQAMNEAARSPAGFGLREDAFVQRLESAAAAMLGKEDALFCPTCTQANQIAINVHCSPGQLVAGHPSSHIFTSEAGACAALSGVSPLAIEGDAAHRGGEMSLGDLEASLQVGDALRSTVGLVWLENTHMRSGGRVLALDYIAAVSQLSARASTPFHIDGARLPNAALALNTSLDVCARGADTVSLSLNKGLGAPLGAVLAGSSEFIAQAEVVRQRFGGGWRPAGIPAAAALVALNGWQAKLGEDHRRASWLAQTLSAVPGIELDPLAVESNLLLLSLQEFDATALTNALQRENVLVLPYSQTEVRLALYHGIDDVAVQRVAQVLIGLVRG
jgi:threonine aldolase